MPYLMLDAVSAVGASETHSSRTVPRNYSVEVTTSDVETDVTFSLQGSITEDIWFIMADHTFSSDELTNQGAMISVVNYPVKNVRVVLTTFSAVGTLSASIEVEVLA